MNTSADPPPDRRGFFDALIGDGRPLITLTGLGLIGSGLFACFLGATGHFLPHDLAYLDTPASALWAVADSRLAYFMIHDRVSFGGAVLGVGVLYLWLAEFPLRRGEGWAWWTLLVSSLVGYGSFLAYLGGGYVDTWRGAATLALLPPIVLGLTRSLPLVRPLPPVMKLFTGWPSPSGGRHELGRTLLAVTACCLVLGGAVIAGCGMTTVFVPQDLEYLGVSVDELCGVNPRLVPLIAHDRAGFGGGVCCCGVTMLCCVLHGRPSAALWQALLVTGVAGFGAGIGVHYPIGYTDFTHLAPAYLGAAMFAAGLGLTRRGMVGGDAAAHPRAAAISAAHVASSGERGGVMREGSA